MDKLKQLLQKKEARRKELANKGKTTESVEELRSINAELDDLNTEIEELRSAIAEGENNTPEARSGNIQTDASPRQPFGPTQVMGTYGVGAQVQNSSQQRSVDPHDTPEYRQAFMNFVQGGMQAVAPEQRNNFTQLEDIGAVIPTTILNRIVQKLRETGRIWSRISRSNVQGGIQIPISNLKPKATWVRPGTMSPMQSMDVNDYISFKYHKLQCQVGVELVAGVVSLQMFEEMVVENVYEAMIYAIEDSIINGSGMLEPLGITRDPDIPSSQKIQVTSEELGEYATWTKIVSSQGRRYRNGSTLILNDSDWNKYIVGATDENGQPIARVNYGIDGSQQERLLGREALVVDEYLPSIDDAAPGDVVGILLNLSDYLMNSNMQIRFVRWFDEGTDNWINKSTLIADGKLADRHGVILIVKA